MQSVPKAGSVHLSKLRSSDFLEAKDLTQACMCTKLTHFYSTNLYSLDTDNTDLIVTVNHIYYTNHSGFKNQGLL